MVKTLDALMDEKTVLWFCYKRRRKRDKDCVRLIGKAFHMKVVMGAWEAERIWLFEVRRREGMYLQRQE